METQEDPLTQVNPLTNSSSGVHSQYCIVPSINGLWWTESLSLPEAQCSSVGEMIRDDLFIQMETFVFIIHVSRNTSFTIYSIYSI